MKTLFLAIALAPFALFAQQSSLTKLANFSPADSSRGHVMVSGHRVVAYQTRCLIAPFVKQH